MHVVTEERVELILHIPINIITMDYTMEIGACLHVYKLDTQVITIYTLSQILILKSEWIKTLQEREKNKNKKLNVPCLYVLSHFFSFFLLPPLYCFALSRYLFFFFSTVVLYIYIGTFYCFKPESSTSHHECQHSVTAFVYDVNATESRTHNSAQTCYTLWEWSIAIR